MLGVLKAVAEGRYQHSATLVLAVHEKDGSLVGAVVQTPSHPVLISALPAAAISVLAESLLERGLPFRTMAPDSVSEPLRAALCSDPSLEARCVTRMRLFQLERVIPPIRRAPGKLRRAAPDDRGTLATFFQEFHAEALAHEPVPTDPDRIAAHAVASNCTFLWEHEGEAVCLASYGREIGSGVSIGPVYTPVEKRGHGYASALVAALSQHLLDGGRRYTCLFTDLSNQTSNKIYARIGYRPVSDFSQWDITRTSAA